jgi:hemerythrin
VGRPVIRWDKSLELGHEVIDAQHKRMVDAAHALYESIRTGSGPVLVRAVALTDATAVHFAYEERLMREARYPDAEVHAENHQGLIFQLQGFTQSALSGEYDTRADTAFRFLNDWVTSHIMNFDSELVEHLKGS